MAVWCRGDVNKCGGTGKRDQDTQLTHSTANDVPYRFRRSTVSRLRALHGVFGELVRASIVACDPSHEDVPLLYGWKADSEEAAQPWKDLDARLGTALEWIDSCVAEWGADMVFSLV